MRCSYSVKIRAELRDPSGRLIRAYPWVPANSLIAAFLKLLKVQMSTANETIKDTAGVDHSIAQNAANFSCNAPAPDTTFGMVIGTGTNPVTMTDYKLQTQVTTNITHTVQSFALDAPNASTYVLDLIRSFTNNTGATLGIREVALYCKGLTYVHCVDRTLYSVDVPAGLAVTFTYRFIVSL